MDLEVNLLDESKVNPLAEAIFLKQRPFLASGARIGRVSLEPKPTHKHMRPTLFLFKVCPGVQRKPNF